MKKHPAVELSRSGIIISVLMIATGFGIRSLNSDLGSTVAKQFQSHVRASDTSASFRWHPLLFSILSFGQLPASVDWLLIRFLTDGNYSKIKEGEETETFRILELATTIDPAFYALYTAGSSYLAVARNDRHGALKLINRGVRFLEENLPSYPADFREREWDLAWRIYLTQGYIYLIEFQDVEKASSAYGKMGQYANLPTGLVGISKSIRTSEGKFRIALNSLGAIKRWYLEDPEILADLEVKEKNLRHGQQLFLMNREFLKYKEKSSQETREEKFLRFLSENKYAASDSYGNRYFLNSDGLIDSSTPRETVFGINLGSIDVYLKENE